MGSKPVFMPFEVSEAPIIIHWQIPQGFWQVKPKKKGHHFSHANTGTRLQNHLLYTKKLTSSGLQIVSWRTYNRARVVRKAYTISTVLLVICCLEQPEVHNKCQYKKKRTKRTKETKKNIKPHYASYQVLFQNIVPPSTIDDVLPFLNNPMI